MVIRRMLPAVAGLSLLVACSTGGAASGPAGSGGTAAGAGKKITVWIMQGTNKEESAFFDKVKADFKSKTGADADVQFVPWADAHAKFLTSIAGGTAPDVAEVGTTWTGEFAEAGALADLSSQIKAAGGTESLVKGLVESANINGKMYGMPWYAGVRSVVYRKDLFAKAGITKEPTTWAELRDAALKVKASSPDVTPFPVPGDASYVWFPFVWGAGGDLATQNGGKWQCSLDSDKAKAGMQFYADLALKDGLSNAAATTWKETDVRDAFIKGQAAAIVSGSWTIPAIVAKNADLKDKIGVMPIPGQNGGMSPSFLGGSNLSVFQTSKNPDLAWEFTKLLATGTYAEEWAKATNFFPGTNDLMKKTMASNDPMVAPFAKQFADGGKSVPTTPLWGKVEGAKINGTLMQSVLSGKASVSDAAKTACDAANKIYAGS